MTPEIPKDLEAEAAICASMMMDPEALQHAVALAPTAFYSDRYRRLFLACAKTFALRGVVDPLLVRDQLEESGDLKFVGGAAELGKLTRPDGFSFRHAKHYVDILQREEARRSAYLAANDLARISVDSDAAAIVAAFRDRARRLEEGAKSMSLRRVLMAEIAFGQIPDIPWIAEDWFGAGDSFVLGGEWGTGKSYLALDLAVSLAAGIPWLGHIPITRAVPVLYLDEENNEINARIRLSKVLNGRGIEKSAQATLGISYLTMNRIKLNTARGQSIVRREVDATKAKVLILDSMVRFAKGLKSSDSDALAAFHDEAITSLKIDLGVTVFGLDHMRKPQKDDDKSDPAHRIVGGQEKSSFGDSVATFSRDREVSNGELRASKVRWTTTLPPRVATNFNTSEDDTCVWISGKDATIDAELIVHELLSDAGAEGMRATPLFKKSESRGANYKTVTRTVQRMVKRGKVDRVEVPGGVVYSLAVGTG